MYIDLTHRLSEETPTYPGDPKTHIRTVGTIEEDANLLHEISIGTHSGTHIDAPAHKIGSGKSLDMFSVDSFVGRGRYILVENNVFSLEAVQNADIQEGDIVVFNTEMSYRFNDPNYFKEYPAMSEQIAEYLVERKVKMVGVDTCSIDNKPDFPIHKILLGHNILVIENLTNLEQLSGMNCTIYALPMRMNLDGAPARVIAEVH